MRDRSMMGNLEGCDPPTLEATAGEGGGVGREVGCWSI